MLINSGHGCSGEQRDRCRKYQGNQENASISPSISSARCRPEVFHRPPRHGCSDPPGPCPPLTAGPGPLPRGATATAQWCGRAAPRPKHRRNVPGAGANPLGRFQAPNAAVPSASGGARESRRGPTQRGLSPPSNARPPGNKAAVASTPSSPGSCRLRSRAAPFSRAGPRPQGRRPPAPRPSRPALPPRRRPRSSSGAVPPAGPVAAAHLARAAPPGPQRPPPVPARPGRGLGDSNGGSSQRKPAGSTNHRPP